MLGKGIEGETYKNQTAEDDEYLVKTVAGCFDKISFSEEEKERIYCRVRDTAKCMKLL